MEGTSNQRRWKLLFRAFGYYFHGSEMVHCKTWMLLSHFVATNRDRHRIRVLDGDIENHDCPDSHPIFSVSIICCMCTTAGVLCVCLDVDMHILYTCIALKINLVPRPRPAFIACSTEYSACLEMRIYLKPLCPPPPLHIIFTKS